MSIIAKVISGGQTGVDIAALRAAKRHGIPTGGTMPKGFRTLAGPKPEWAREFGLAEHSWSSYPPRTFQNVKDAAVTIRIAVDFDSRGEELTLKAIQEHGKPRFDLRIGELAAPRRVAAFRVAEAEIFECVWWLEEQRKCIGRPLIVNVAGNSEQTAPGIERIAEGVVWMIIEGTYA